MRREDPPFDPSTRPSEPTIPGSPQACRSTEGFQACYQTHLPELMGFAASRIGRIEAEDLVAETFARAWRSMPAPLLTGDGNARAWLFRVLRNLLIDRGRSQGVVQRAGHRVQCQYPTWLDDQTEPQSERDEVRLALARLPARQRLVLELRFSADLDAAQTGTVLGLNADAVRALTYRATRALREALGERESIASEPRR